MTALGSTPREGSVPCLRVDGDIDISDILCNPVHLVTLVNLEHGILAHSFQSKGTSRSSHIDANSFGTEIDIDSVMKQWVTSK